MKPDLKPDLPPGFSSPTELPTEERRSDWQRRNRSWWEANPMRYDWKEELGLEEYSAEFYKEIDRRFFEDAEHYMPPRVRPFDTLVPFEALGSLDVLEIGIGSGSHAQLLAPHCRSYTGVDLTEYAVTSTSKRFQRFAIKGCILRTDAEQMSFADASFDYIWSWGVIHHSADTGRVLREMHRVLRPGGQATVMIYHRSWLYTYLYTALLRGIFGRGLLKHSLHELLQLNTDGAIARFYSRSEWASLAAANGFSVECERIMGQKSEVILIPAGSLKNAVTRLVPDAVTRFITNTCRQGSFLITTLRRK